MATFWITFIVLSASIAVCHCAMCYYTSAYYDQFTKGKIYKPTHRYCATDCCETNKQGRVTCCKDTEEEDDDKDNENSNSTRKGLVSYTAVLGILLGVVFGLTVCVLVGIYIRKLCCKPIAKLEPKRGKPQHHRAACYLAKLNKPKPNEAKKDLRPPTRRPRRISRRMTEATNFAFEEDEYEAVLDCGANPTTDYFYDDISDGPSPSPILYNDFEKGGFKIVVSPSCIDFHNLDDDENIMGVTSADASPMPQRSVSIDAGQMSSQNRTESLVGISGELGQRHASIC